VDWGTHVVLAGKLLHACELEVGAAIYSVLPAIDIKPIHYHRQYAHLLANVPLIRDAALEILGSPEVAQRDFQALREATRPRIQELRRRAGEAEGNPALDRAAKRQARDRAYFYERIADEAEGFTTRELAGAIEVLGPEAANISRDPLAVALSIVSHPYFDTFNNPVATFIPLAANYAAQWELWKGIRYLDFKTTFYTEEIISRFRQKIAGSSVWTDPVDASREVDPDIRRRILEAQGQPYSAHGFIKAMIERLGSLSPGLSPNAVDLAIRDFFSQLGVRDLVHADRELLLCLNVEKEISHLIRQDYSA